MELAVKTDLERELPKRIDFNYEQLKGQLAEKLTRYQGLVVTEDGIKEAKADKTALNKLRTALDEKRKEVKKDCMRPYEDFEAKVKELISMVDQPMLAIDKQIKTFDERKKEEKRAEIVGLYQEKIGSLAALLPFEKFFNSRWLNVTYKMSDIQKELSDSIFKADNDIRIINAMGLECGQQMVDAYIRTLDMSAALAEKTRWEEQQKKIREYETAQKKQKEAAQQVQEPQHIIVDGTHGFENAKPGDYIHFGGDPETAPMPFDEPHEDLKTISVTFRDTTTEFRHQMGALCRQYGIIYGWAKKEDLE